MVKRGVGINMPHYVEKAIEELEKNGFEAYAVGGAVRDCLMGENPSDWDITTSATPVQTKTVFSAFPTFDTGIKHGTVTVLIDGYPLEITTFRKESGYSDSRHPSSVEFVSSLSEDLRRRDFTVNSLVYSKKTGLIDLYGGLSDIDNKIIRTVGLPNERFSEDALRILRAVRFSSKLGFKIESETFEEIKKQKSSLAVISKERIFSELVKTLEGENVFNALTDCVDVISEIIPELKGCLATDGGKNNIYKIASFVAETQKVGEIRFAALLCNVGVSKSNSLMQAEANLCDKESFAQEEISAKKADEILRRLKSPTAFRERVIFLVKNQSEQLVADKIAVKVLLSKFGTERFFDFLEFKRAYYSVFCGKTSEKPNEILKIKAIAEQIIENDECFSVKQLKIDGNALKETGFKGKAVGYELERLLTVCIKDPSQNEFEKLARMAREHYAARK